MKDERLTTVFEPSKDKDVLCKTYLDTKLSKVQELISFIEKEYNNFKVGNDRLSEEEGVLIESAMKATIQILSDTGFFDRFIIANER